MDWASAIGGMSAQEIFENFSNGAGPSTLESAQQVVHGLSQTQQQRAEQTQQVMDKLHSAWQGNAADAAVASLQPGAVNAMERGQDATTAQDLLQRQIDSFNHAKNTVQPVPPEPVLQDPIQAALTGQYPQPFMTQLAHQTAVAATNVDAMHTYSGASTYNAANLPAYDASLASPASGIQVTAAPASVAGQSTHRAPVVGSGSGGVTPAGQATGSRSARASSGPSTVNPAGGGVASRGGAPAATSLSNAAPVTAQPPATGTPIGGSPSEGTPAPSWGGYPDSGMPDGGWPVGLPGGGGVPGGSSENVSRRLDGTGGGPNDGVPGEGELPGDQSGMGPRSGSGGWQGRVPQSAGVPGQGSEDGPIGPRGGRVGGAPVGEDTPYTGRRYGSGPTTGAEPVDDGPGGGGPGIGRGGSLAGPGEPGAPEAGGVGGWGGRSGPGGPRGTAGNGVTEEIPGRGIGAGAGALAEEERMLGRGGDGGPMAPGVMGGRGERRGEDIEHKRKYDYGQDPNVVFGELPKVVPETLGETPEQRDARRQAADEH